MSNTTEQTAAFKAGDQVKIIGYYDYNGQAVPAWAKQQAWTVKSVKGDKVAVYKKEKKCTAIYFINQQDLKAVK